MVAKLYQHTITAHVSVSHSKQVM